MYNVNKEDIFAGIDVSKNHLDLGLTPSGQFERFNNDETGVAGSPVLFGFNPYHIF